MSCFVGIWQEDCALCLCGKALFLFTGLVIAQHGFSRIGCPAAMLGADFRPASAGKWGVRDDQ